MTYFWQERGINHAEDLAAHRELYAEATRNYAYYQAAGDEKRATACLEEMVWRMREIQRLEQVLERKDEAGRKARELLAGA
jgi:hypothetical protein